MRCREEVGGLRRWERALQREGLTGEGMVAVVLRRGGLVGRHASGVTAKETAGGSYHDAAH